MISQRPLSLYTVKTKYIIFVPQLLGPAGPPADVSINLCALMFL